MVHSNPPPTSPSPWNKDPNLSFLLHVPAGMFGLMNRCHSYGRTHATGSEVTSSPQSHSDNMGGGRLCSSGEIFAVLRLPCTAHDISVHTLQNNICVPVFFSGSISSVHNPQQVLCGFVLNLYKIQSSWAKLHSSVLLCERVPVAREQS